MADSPTTTVLDVRREGDALVLSLAGEWKYGAKLPAFSLVEAQFREKAPPGRITFETKRMSGWDSALMTYLQKVGDLATLTKTEMDTSGLPDGAASLLKLATAVPKKEGTDRDVARVSFVTSVGNTTLKFGNELNETAVFIGESTLSIFRFMRGKARFRWRDLWLIVQQAGAEALPIVALINFLVGVILAFVGAVQLKKFGADIYVADLVGLAMVREMGAIMTGIIMCGRTGAAFAASLGSMKVSEEIDALKTLGISPMDFLVLPRLLALGFMMPMLVLFADFIGIVGGMLVSVSMLDITLQQFINRCIQAITIPQFSTGIIKAVVIGGIVAGAGCLRGMQCGNSSAAVGMATTSAVVTGITLIIVTDAVFAVIFNILGM
ncbi:MlaE family ABC transporter permease [Cerasicoccus arenae]|uniref:ABC transporter permease n=1 Tax=Cerasicoccus arenae TaxID=424488 RepID=A0A8J3GE87_9BACT|nr:ABC transporter permease [Cerasicoccus arenae]MBK1859094.1 ABC transporter permease [Cerasicoccus arenae]GHC07585.1 ABC transporter permease [Cerasicoccus arenae]